jgi:hypothetical protein
MIVERGVQTVLKREFKQKLKKLSFLKKKYGMCVKSF